MLRQRLAIAHIHRNALHPPDGTLRLLLCRAWSQRLWDEHRIEIPVSHDGELLRISIAAYNDRADVDKLLSALAG